MGGVASSTKLLVTLLTKPTPSAQDRVHVWAPSLNPARLAERVLMSPDDTTPETTDALSTKTSHDKVCARLSLALKVKLVRTPLLAPETGETAST